MEYLQITYNDLPLKNEMEYCGVLPFCNSKLFTQSIIEFAKLTSGDDVKQVYDVTIDIAGIDHEFYPGDAIGVLANNNAQEVDVLMDILDLKDLNYKLSIMDNTTKKKAVIPSHVPSEGSVRGIFDEFLDIRSLPKKAFLKMLSQYTTDQEEKNELLMLGSPKSENYNLFISNEGRTLLNVLRKFTTCKPPLERLLEHLPALKPRFYSISSSDTKTISITFSVVDGDNSTSDCNRECDEVFKGVCSSYLENLLLSENTENKKMHFYFRQSTNFLRFEPEFNHPVILIGPGTGVAPFRGFLQAQAQCRNLINNQSMIHLFYGCRYSDRDFLYKNELNECVEKGVLAALHVAFSRETNMKVYVQDKIKEQGHLITDLILNQGAYVRLCGDAKNLTKAINDALKDVIMEFGKLDDKECDDFLREIKVSGRYSLDVWL